MNSSTMGWFRRFTDKRQGLWHLLEMRKDRGTAESVCFFVLYHHGCECLLCFEGLKDS